MWFITLLVLAVAAVLIIKAVKAHSERQSRSADLPASNGLQGALPKEASPAEPSRQKPPTEPDSTLEATPASTPAAKPQDSATSASESRSPDTLTEIREMIKILNLAESDSARLGISSEEFSALRHSGDPDSVPSALPDASAQKDVADRLRRMLN